MGRKPEVFVRSLEPEEAQRLVKIATKHAPRMGEKLTDAILAALDEQTVTVPRHHRGGHRAAPARPQLENRSRTTQASGHRGRGDP
jgi:hypothetical protein